MEANNQANNETNNPSTAAVTFAAAPGQAEQVNAQAVLVGGALAQQAAPQYAAVIDAVAQEEPVVFHLLMALLHARRAAGKAAA